MFNAKKTIAAIAIALMASLGTALPAEAASDRTVQMRDSWCC